MIAQPQSDTTEIIYPESDGQPMADNTKQFRWIVTIKENLEILFADQPDVFVAGDLLWYPVQGNNRLRQAPDAMVVFGRPKGDRGSYQQWKENNIAPQVVFEILSPGNTKDEMKRKLLFYIRHGVDEYYEYDPDNNTLVGSYRVTGTFTDIPTLQGWVSPRLNIRFELSDTDLTIYSPNGEPFLTPVELAQERDRARQKAEDERQRAEDERQRAEDERQRAEDERQRAEDERQRAEDEHQRAEDERQRAEDERQRADRLAARLRELGVDPDQV